MTRRPLPQVREHQQGLGLPTIMDRALAAEYGVAYVHLAVFCIDLDRLHQEHLEDERLPFGWEVFLTESVLYEYIDPDDADAVAMLDEMCESILQSESGHGALGSHIVFAVYAAASRGLLPKSLLKRFGRWRGLPPQLETALAPLHAQGDAARARLAAIAASLDLEPPAAPPTREALEKMAAHGGTRY